jgi:hypothetical protein
MAFLSYSMNSCLFVETSAKLNEAVDQAFDELLNKVRFEGGVVFVPSYKQVCPQFSLCPCVLCRQFAACLYLT